MAKKFQVGFLAGFIFGLFGYMGYTVNWGGDISVMSLIVWSLIPAIIMGVFLTFDRSRTINTEKV